MRTPRQRWRTLPADGQMEFADDEKAVRVLARTKAQALGTDVAIELWSELHPQDPLNQGWACIGVERYVGPNASHRLVGKTIAAVAEKDVTLRDTYDDEYTVTQTTLTFSDGTEMVFGDIQMDLYEV